MNKLIIFIIGIISIKQLDSNITKPANQVCPDICKKNGLNYCNAAFCDPDDGCQCVCKEKCEIKAPEPILKAQPQPKEIKAKPQTEPKKKLEAAKPEIKPKTTVKVPVKAEPVKSETKKEQLAKIIDSSKPDFTVKK